MLMRIEERDKINVEDVTGIKIARATSYAWTVLGFIAAVVSIIIGMAWIGALSFVVGIIVDLIITKNYLSIEYAGGHVRFSVKKYSMENVSAFQEAVFRVKDSLSGRA